ncbi:MAG TPA: M42 family metallopeptidase, partial [Deinococcales bacterium]|nr:M42 family metallopeptidase [Deinococcales bacterium]
MPFDLDATVDLLADLLRIPSPTGFTSRAVSFLEAELVALDVQARRTRKGALAWTLPGRDGTAPRAVSAHVDTLGAMVREIKPNGRLKLTQVGGYDWATVEGEHCLVHTVENGPISGTVVNTKQSVHVFAQELRDLKRDEKVMEVRLDADATTAEAVRALGVSVGDFVSYDPRVTVLENGFVKSRHLDNKAATAILVGVTRAIVSDGLELAAPTTFFVSNFEETGHGASAGIPADTAELLAVDMAAVGEGQSSSEHCVTLCVKDSSGPYDHDLGLRLRRLAREAGLDLRVDTYPSYASDASAAL